MENQICYKLFIGGIAAREEPQQIQDYFSKFGPILCCKIKKDKKTDRGKGYGYITCEDQETFQKILNEPLHTINNRVVECKELLKKDKLTDKLRDEEKLKLFVGNLDEKTTNETLTAYFLQFGTVTNAYVLSKPGSNHSRCFGFVHFDNEEPILRVLKKTEHLIDNKIVDISRFQNKVEQRKQKDQLKKKKKREKRKAKRRQVAIQSTNIDLTEKSELKLNIINQTPQHDNENDDSSLEFGSSEDETAERYSFMGNNNLPFNCNLAYPTSTVPHYPGQNFFNQYYQGPHPIFQAPPMISSYYPNFRLHDYNCNPHASNMVPQKEADVGRAETNQVDINKKDKKRFGEFSLFG